MSILRRPTDSNHGTKLIKKSSVLLRLIANSNHQGARLVDLTLHSGLERPTVRRILKGLIDEGFVLQAETNGRYFLGSLLFELGLAASHRFKLADLAAPSLDRIAAETGDCVYLVQRSGLDAVCIAWREGSFPVKVLAVEAGTRRPLGAAAGSLAILMNLPVEEREAIIEANRTQMESYERLTGRSTAEAVQHSLALGFALMPTHVTPFVSAVGVAIPGRAGPVNSSLSVSALTDRILNNDRYLTIAKLLKKEVDEIALLLAKR